VDPAGIAGAGGAAAAVDDDPPLADLRWRGKKHILAVPVFLLRAPIFFEIQTAASDSFARKTTYLKNIYLFS
jgi:hypothetical protein